MNLLNSKRKKNPAPRAPHVEKEPKKQTIPRKGQRGREGAKKRKKKKKGASGYTEIKGEGQSNRNDERAKEMCTARARKYQTARRGSKIRQQRVKRTATALRNVKSIGNGPRGGK